MVPKVLFKVDSIHLRRVAFAWNEGIGKSDNRDNQNIPRRI